jgi:hypothetical protein
MKIKFFISVLILSSLYLLLNQKYFFPADVLNNIPSFSESGWERPKNSLLADPVFQFEPWRDFAKKEILSGRIPLWNDLNGGGAPLFANSISSVLFPLNFIYYVFPERIGILLISIAKLFLFSFFTYLYLRSIKVNKSISFLGAVIGSFSGYMILWLHWPQTNLYIFLPLLLFLTEKIRSKNKFVFRWYILVAISYSLVILGGHPETLFHIFLLHSFYIIYRFYKQKKLIMRTTLAIFVGFLLGAVQLIPFIEYLFYSFALENRASIAFSIYLPTLGFLYNFFPFLFGAPNFLYYKPFNPQSNFQEMTGGYVGFVTILIVLFCFYFIRKKTPAVFWFFVILISWVLSYKVWPFFYLNNLPLFNVSANNRLIAFAGFGIIVLFSMLIQEFVSGKLKLTFLTKISNKIYVILILLILIGFGLALSILPAYFLKYSNYIPQLLKQAFIVLISSIFILWAITLYLNKKITYIFFYSILFISLSLQTLLFFISYNPLIDQKNYYPKTDLVQKLQKLPNGNILEIGNPSLPANVNIKYQFPHTINNDAVEVAWYKKEFEKTFKFKNNWGNPEEVNQEMLKKFNVSYALSDFNINLKKEIIQKEDTEVLSPLNDDNKYLFNFSPKNGNIKQIRIKTANFNRNNNCMLKIQVIDNYTKKILTNIDYPCADIRNNVFLTFPTEISAQNSNLNLKISAINTDSDNAVALYGKKGIPYLELLYDNNKKDFDLLGKTKSTYIWKVDNGGIIEGVDSYSILYSNPQRLVVNISSKKEKEILVKKTYFPGWVAKLNGKNVEIVNSNPFMKIQVPIGDSYLELQYKPISFYSGLLISLIIAFFIFIFWIRKEIQNGLNKRFDSFRNLLILRSKTIKIWQHAFIVFLGIIGSIIFYLLIVLIIKPSFNIPFSTTISWYTVHNYPRQQEYFYFLTFVPFIFIVTSLIWLIVIWKRKT